MMSPSYVFGQMNVPNIGVTDEVSEVLVNVLVGTKMWDMTKGNKFHLKYRRFSLNIRKHLFLCGGDQALTQIAQ